MKNLLPLVVALLAATPAIAKDLPGSSRGEDAIKQHSHQLEKIAARYKITREKLEHQLRSDKSHVLDREGRLYISDEQLLPDYVSENTPSFNPSAAQIPDSETFRLHSKPGSKKTIHLDFNGHLVQNTSWNYSGDINAGPMDVDGNPSTFSADERARIKEIWLRVAEDYAPFDVDVTTEDVPLSAIRIDFSGDQVFGTRVIITNSNEWYGTGAGGVAYLGSFGWGDDTPSWVFTKLLNHNPKYVAEAASHEAGHTLSLRHQASYDSAGNKTSDYSTGLGTGNYGWAPIMGVGYYKKITTWHNGPNSFGPTSYQDDVAMIRSYLPVKSDDAPDSVSATSFTRLRGSSDGVTQQFRHQGTFETRSNADVLRVYAGAGPLNLQVAEVVHGGTNIDFRVRLISPSGQVMADQNPAGAANVAFSFADVPEGIYSLQLTPSGFSDATGVVYTDYGILGRYYVTGSAAAYTGTIPSDTFGSGGGATPPPAPANQAPTVNAGVDRTITLPTTSTTLSGSASDADGSVASVSWSQVSGPVSGTIVSPTSLSTTVSGLQTAGTYTFRLTATDNLGLSKSDDVIVTVKACKGKCR